MNSRQRRTVRRAKDARRPWGRAVERERRKGKRAKRPLEAALRECAASTAWRDVEATIL